MNKRFFLSTLLAVVAFVAQAQQQLPMRLWYDRPAEFFEEALPLGNGLLGALVYGNPADDKIELNDITFWTGKPSDPNVDKDAYKWVPKVREALFREDYRAADSLQRHLQGPNSARYMPLGTLNIRSLDAQPTSGYYRSLTLDSAIAMDTYRMGGVKVKKEYLVSYPDNVVAIRITADGGRISEELQLSSLVESQVKVSAGQLMQTGHATGDVDETVHFCTILRALPDKGATVQTTDSSLIVRNMSSMVVYIVNKTSFNGYNRHPVLQGAPYMEIAKQQAAKVVKKSFDKIKARHVADYRQFFPRVKLLLGGDYQQCLNNMQSLPTNLQLKNYTDKKEPNRYLETLYFQYGRYLLIAASRTAPTPANLQGIWNPYLEAPWRSNYTVNINLEENYWPAEVANLSEMTEPLWNLMRGLADNGSYVAKNYYGVNRGFCSSHNSDLWAMANPVGEKTGNPHWANWGFGFAWLTMNLWDHYLYTQDKTFLRKTAWPMLKGASEFMLDWLVENPNNPEELVTAPSTSPENDYKTDDGYVGMTVYGGTADLAIIRELFKNTIEAATLMNDKKMVDDVSKALARLHPYTAGKEGDLNEWYHDWKDPDPHHRHQSHLIGLYPGTHITQAETPEVAKACVNTLIQKGDRTTGWSTGWRMNLWARLHNAGQAYHIFQKLLNYMTPDKYEGPDKRGGYGVGGTYPNLWDAHAPFQIDGNFGGTAGVCEMLLQSSTRQIEFLPALPNAWDAGSVSGLCARGGVEVGMKWSNHRLQQATLKPRQNCTVELKYGDDVKTVKLKKGKVTTVTF